MYICLCKSVSDKKIAQLLALGNDTLDKIQSSCHAGLGCGACIDQLEQTIEENKKSTKHYLSSNKTVKFKLSDELNSSVYQSL